MSDRKAEIRKFMEEKHTESWAVLAQLGDDHWDRQVYSDEDGGWTVHSVLVHVADAEKGHLGQLKRLLAGQPTLPPDFDLDRWNRGTVARGADRSPADLLAAIKTSYAGLLTLLDDIPEADLDKVGRHARGDDLNIEDFLRRVAAHRAQHAREVHEAIADNP